MPAVPYAKVQSPQSLNGSKLCYSLPQSSSRRGKRIPPPHWHPELRLCSKGPLLSPNLPPPPPTSHSTILSFMPNKHQILFFFFNFSTFPECCRAPSHRTGRLAMRAAARQIALCTCSARSNNSHCCSCT